jgi:hypothetical protein
MQFLVNEIIRYDHDFRPFSTIFREKMAIFSLKTMKLLFLAQNSDFFSKVLCNCWPLGSVLQ